MTIKITFGPDKNQPSVYRSPMPIKLDAQIPGTEHQGLDNTGKDNLSCPAKENENVTEILDELDAFIGLGTVKQLIRELLAYVEIQKRRTQEKLIAEPLVLHMIFRGNPGTGKTTVARLVGRLFKEMGVLQKGHVIECERADLVGEYIGHTAKKTKAQLRKALGGVLFIDEAYSLARGGEKDFGKEAIDALVKAMEDNKDNVVLILAGYRKEMDWFLQANPGLRSRFPIHIDFPDYSLDELLSIGNQMLEFRQYELTSEASDSLRLHLQSLFMTHPYAGNARLVRNLIEKAVRKQAVRLYQKPTLTREELMQILPVDLYLEDT